MASRLSFMMPYLYFSNQDLYSKKILNTVNFDYANEICESKSSKIINMINEKHSKSIIRILVLLGISAVTEFLFFVSALAFCILFQEKSMLKFIFEVCTYLFFINTFRQAEWAFGNIAEKYF